MPLFSYIAIDKEGKQKEGTLEVGSQNEAITVPMPPLPPVITIILFLNSMILPSW